MKISLYMTSDFLGESVEMAYKCQNCDYVSQDLSNHRRHLEGVHGGAVYKCKICSKEFKWQRSLRRHMAMNHPFGVSRGGFKGFAICNSKSFTHNGEIGLSSPMPNKNHFGSGYNVDNIHRVFDIGLKENFKLFVSGPSRCGKTVFVAKLIENIQSFAKQPLL